MQRNTHLDPDDFKNPEMILRNRPYNFGIGLTIAGNINIRATLYYKDGTTKHIETELKTGWESTL